MLPCDLGDPGGGRDTLVERTVAELGPIDILVNNAAAAMYAPLEGYSLKRRRFTFEVNVHAPLDLAQQVIPEMRARGAGWIVNLSSGAARHVAGPPFDGGGVGSTIGVYGASKAALNRLTNALALELHGAGIRVNTVEPRAAVLSPGAETLVGGILRPDQIESMEEMVEATLALCDCPPERTGQVLVSLDLIAQLGLRVMTLDGKQPWVKR
jgi:NAD(P)-dependent dehydrogenase (short-subunit alcohol dehydrogenase family)